MGIKSWEITFLFFVGGSCKKYPIFLVEGRLMCLGMSETGSVFDTFWAVFVVHEQSELNKNPSHFAWRWPRGHMFLMRQYWVLCNTRSRDKLLLKFLIIDNTRLFLPRNVQSRGYHLSTPTVTQLFSLKNSLLYFIFAYFYLVLSNVATSESTVMNFLWNNRLENSDSICWK